MEKTPIPQNKTDSEKPKTYLYHMVPIDMQPNEEGKEVLYPLNMIEEKFPGLYKIKADKYNSRDEHGNVNEYRKNIPNTIIPVLEKATWGDVVQLTAIHPKDLKVALEQAGLNPEEFKFYQIDPELLDPQNTTIFLYRDDIADDSKENFTKYDPLKLEEYASVPQKAKDHYAEVSEFNKKVLEHNRAVKDDKDMKSRKRPTLFVGVPHIFHKGSIDVSNFPVIVV